MPSKWLIWWAYVVELLAAGATLLALSLLLGAPSVVAFIRNIALDTATLFSAVMFAASLGFLWTFYSKSDTDFYRWLDSRGAFKVYLSATVYAVIVSLLSTLTLVAVKHITNDTFTLFTTFLLLLAIINLITLIKNVMGLMRLNAKFNQTPPHR